MASGDISSRNNKKKKKDLDKKREEIALYIEAYIDRLEDCLKAWGGTYQRVSAIDWLERIKKKSQEYDDITPGRSPGMVLRTIITRIKGILTTNYQMDLLDEHMRRLKDCSKWLKEQ